MSKGAKILILLIVRVVLALITVSFAAYGLITKDFNYQSYMLFFMGLLMLVVAIDAFGKGHKVNGSIASAAFIFIMLVLISL